MTTPTVIMIGGQLTLHGGETIDTRQQIRGDRWDAVQRAACFRSELWWDVALDIATLLLDDISDDSRAILWAPKSVYVPQRDGSTKRKAIKTVLKSQGGSYLDLMSLPPQPGAALDVWGTDKRWNLLEHKFRFEDVVARSFDLFVGAAHDFDDMNIKRNTLAPFDQLPRLMPTPILLLPDTPYVRSEVDDFLAWHSAGMPSENGRAFPEVDHRSTSDDTERLKDIRPVVVAADLQVTRWLDCGEEKEASELQAAFEFRATRYDADVGLLDLARNKLLRDSLLEVTPQQAAPKQRASTPSEVASNLDSLKAERQDDQATSIKREAEIDSQIELLLQQTKRSWRRQSNDPSQPGGFELGIGELVRSTWETDEFLVAFRLKTLKRSLRLQLKAVAINQEHEPEVNAFIDERSEPLQTKFGANAKADAGVLVNLKGYGWADEPDDRDSAMAVVSEVVEYLWADLEQLHTSLSRSHTKWLETRDPARPSKHVYEVIIEPSNDSHEGKPGLLGRIFGRGRKH